MSTADKMTVSDPLTQPPADAGGAVATAPDPADNAPLDPVEVEEQLDFDRDPANTGTHLPLFWRVVVMLLTVAGVVLVLNQVFF